MRKVATPQKVKPPSSPGLAKGVEMKSPDRNQESTKGTVRDKPCTPQKAGSMSTQSTPIKSPATKKLKQIPEDPAPEVVEVADTFEEGSAPPDSNDASEAAEPMDTSAVVSWQSILTCFGCSPKLSK